MKIQLKWLLLELFITSVLTITYSAATAQRNGIIEMKRLRKRTQNILKVQEVNLKPKIIYKEDEYYFRLEDTFSECDSDTLNEFR